MAMMQTKFNMFRIGEIRSPIPQPQDISISSQVKHMENANHERLIFVIVDPGSVTKSRSNKDAFH